MLEDFINEINSLRDDIRAKHHLRFFKTGKGEYGEGDLFLGLSVPQVRFAAKKFYKEIAPFQIQELLKNPYHEIRLGALLMCVFKYETGNFEQKREIFELYFKNILYINNWDLVDLTAPKIAGHFAYHYASSEILKEFAASKSLWGERISIVAGYYFIKKDDFDYVLDICEYFLGHKHDLIHKAAGWMLREAGKRNVQVLENFLNKYAATMPRTMLRYAIEKFPAEKRKMYLNFKK